jgi:hypothetical protein
VTPEEILDEIAERSATFYQGIWQACTPDEKVILTHVAQDGLANLSSRRLVRRLLGRGLLRKDPRLRVMNETFRRFLAAENCRGECVKLEGKSAPSSWDRLRVPLTAAVTVTAAFLFVTQKELFDATVTMATAMTASLPVLFRAIGFMTVRDIGRPDGAARA